MYNRPFSAITISGFILLLFLNFSIPAHSQKTSSANPKQKLLIKAIQKQAKEDAEAGKKQEGVQELDLLFGEEAKEAGLKLRKVAEVYGQAYKAAKKAQPWWKPYKPNFGWIVAGILFILVIFRDILKETI